MNLPLQASRLGLGMAALGRPGYINLGHAEAFGGNTDVAAMEAHAATVLDAAWQGGVRYFDAARSYGRGEVFLGNWLRARGIAPAAVAVGSKWGYTYTADWRVDAPVHEVKDHSLAVLERQWHESQANLGSYLRLYQIHSATLESEVLSNAAVLGALGQLKAQGITIGLSLSGSAQAATLRQALEVTIDGAPLFGAVQATWNILEPSAGPALAEAYTAGLLVIVKEALANGRLTQRNDDPAFAPQRALLEKHAARLGTSLDALALAAALHQPWAGIVLSGAATVAQLDSNLKALYVAWDEPAATAVAAIAEPAEAYWATRKALNWN